MFFDKQPPGKTESIQDIATKLLSEQLELLDTENNPKERTVFVLGSKNVGKSTAINKFFDREEPTRPTLALEYSFDRRTSSSQGIDRQILNVWELGSLENSTELIGVPLRSHKARHFSVVLFLDLSQPKRVWIDLENAYNGLKHAYENQLTKAEITLLKEKSSERVGKEHPDLPTMDLFPFPLVIVGGKYDVFMDFDPIVKKHVCRCLRSVAHVLGASLLFYSSQIPKLSKTLRDTINHLGFGSPSQPFRTFNVDYNGSLSVFFGLDTWDQIGTTPMLLDRIGQAFCQDIPQAKTNKTPTSDDPAKDPGFRESIIDEMRAEKNEELATLFKEKEIRGKFETII